MKRFPWKWLVLVFAAVLIGAAMWVRTSDYSPAPSGVARSTAGRAVAPADARTLDLSGLERPSFWSGVPVQPAERRALAESIRQATAVYFAGSWEDWQRWRSELGISQSDGGKSVDSAEWASRTRILRRGAPQWEQMKVGFGDTSLARTPIASDQAKAVAKLLESGGKDLSAEFGPLQVELQVPIITTTAEGTQVRRTYGMTFQQRRSDGRWIVTGHAFIGPASAGVVIPP